MPTTSPSTLAPGNPVAPQRSAEDYRLQFRSPEGCNISDCVHYIGIDTNIGDNDFLDIYMEGTAAGWVAVGFSETSSMVSLLNVTLTESLLYYTEFHTGVGI